MKTNPISAPIAAEVRPDTESEAAIIKGAKEALSNCSWKLGEFASRWTVMWAKGRTDEDFGAMVGMSGDQVFQRRRVWDRWGGKTDIYRNLSWSHFYAALNWEDADTYLQWASDNQATVAELKAYHRAKTQVNLFSDEDPFGEGAGGTGPDAGGDGEDAEGKEDGTETGGTESEEQPPRPPRSGKEAPGGAEEKPPKTQKELFAELKAKAIKTIEAGMRVIDDLDGLRKSPQHDAILKGLRKTLETVRQWK